MCRTHTYTHTHTHPSNRTERTTAVEADVNQTTAEGVGLSTRKHQEWFDEADEDQELLEEKCTCHNHLLAKSDGQAAIAANKTA